MERRVIDVAGVNPHLDVQLNRKAIPISDSFQSYAVCTSQASKRNLYLVNQINDGKYALCLLQMAFLSNLVLLIA